MGFTGTGSQDKIREIMERTFCMASEALNALRKAGGNVDRAVLLVNAADPDVTERAEDDLQPVDDLEVSTKLAGPQRPARPLMSILNKEDLAKMTAKGGSRIQDDGPYDAEIEEAWQEMLKQKRLWEAGRVPYANFNAANLKFIAAVRKNQGSESEDELLPVNDDHEDEGFEHHAGGRTRPLKPYDDARARDRVMYNVGDIVRIKGMNKTGRITEKYSDGYLVETSAGEEIDVEESQLTGDAELKPVPMKPINVAPMARTVPVSRAKHVRDYAGYEQGGSMANLILGLAKKGRSAADIAAQIGISKEMVAATISEAKVTDALRPV